MNNVLKFHKISGFKRKTSKKNEHCIFQLFKPYHEPNENGAQISVSPLNGEWMPEGSGAESKNNVPLQFHSCHPMTMSVAELLDPAQLSLGKQDESPHMLYSQGPCKCQPSKWYFERQSVWFGFGYFSSPVVRTLLGKLIPDSSL